MKEKNISQEFRWNKIDETRYYFLREVEENELMSRKHKKFGTTLNYIEHSLILASTNFSLYLNFFFRFFDWYSYRNYRFCNKIKNLCNNCRN